MNDIDALSVLLDGEYELACTFDVADACGNKPKVYEFFPKLI